MGSELFASSADGSGSLKYFDPFLGFSHLFFETHKDKSSLRFIFKVILNYLIRKKKIMS